VQVQVVLGVIAEAVLAHPRRDHRARGGVGREAAEKGQRDSFHEHSAGSIATPERSELAVFERHPPC
jgi:hypothetical protein